MARLALAALLLLTWSCGRAPALDDLHADGTNALLRGDVAGALAAAERGAGRAADDAGWRPAFHLLEAEARLMRRDAPAARALLDGALAGASLPPALAARRRMLEGQEQMVLGRMTDAIAVLEDAARQAREADARGVWLETDALLGQALLRTGRWDEAERLLVAARDRATAEGDHAREAGVLINLGMSRLVRQRYDEALPYFDRILTFGDLDQHLVHAAALINAGICSARLGDFDRAIELQSRAVAAHEQRGVDVYLEQALGELGNTHVLGGDAEAGLPYIRRAHEVASAADLTRDAALWAGNLAAVHVDLGRWDDAERFNEEAIRLKQATGTTTLVYNTLNRARIAAGRGAHDAALAAFRETLDTPGAPPAVAWDAHAGMAVVLAGTGRTDEARRHFEQALAIIDGTRSDLLRPEYRISFLSRLIRFHQEYVDLLVTLGAPLDALHVADASRARVLAEGHAVAPVSRARHGDFRQLARQTGARLVAFWVAPRRSFAWIVAPDATRIVELPSAEAIGHLVSDYRAMIETALGDPLGSGAAPAEALAAAVLEPIARHVPAGSAVIVVPDGPLHGVNLEALPVGSPRRYWIEDVVVSVAPSLAVAAAESEPRRRGRPSLLLVGDPVATDLPALRFAGAELDAIARAFPGAAAETYRGPAATALAYEASQPAQFSMIHFAAHATVTSASPLDSSIELSPAGGRHKLYARDVAAQPLGADLVTISACRGAGSRAYSGEGLVGFAWAFLRAGARRVIAGLWDVDDQSTASLMARLYERLAAGDTAAVALRLAKLELIRSGGNFAKPYYWAPFQVYRAAR